MAEVLVTDPELRRDVPAEVRVHHVTLLNEALEQSATFWMREVQSDAPLVVVERFEEEALTATVVRWHISPDVAPGSRILDLDHLCAELGQVYRSERPCTVLFEGEDAEVVEREHSLYPLFAWVQAQDDLGRGTTTPLESRPLLGR